MARFYTVTGASSVSAAADIVEITAPSDAAVRIVYFSLWQKSDAGDAEEETLQVTYRQPLTVSGSGGGTPTVFKQRAGDNSFGGTAEHFNTSAATGGSPIFRYGWNVRIPLEIHFNEDVCPLLPPSIGGFWEISAPADAISLEYFIVLEEIGG
jgi:hypothetical protein